MTDTELSGVCPIVDTPFTDDGEVDYDSLDTLCATLIENGCDALALFGFASEFYKLTDFERELMAEQVTNACEEGGVPSIVSVTAQSTPVAVDEAELFADLGADALMVLPPYVRDPPTSAIYDHLVAVGEAVDIPVMVQYAPGSTGITMSPSFFADLYEEVETIDYFKIECAPPGKFISRLHDLTDDEANILVGRAGYEMIETYDRGATGVMPASAMHDIYVQIHEAYHDGRRETAVDIHSDLVAVLNQLTKVGIQWEKRILADRGIIDSPHCRGPEDSLDEAYEAIYDEYCEKYITPHIDIEATATTLN
jgi:4-hydroxy-tetrahydrodipicolinate synthase